MVSRRPASRHRARARRTVGEALQGRPADPATASLAAGACVNESAITTAVKASFVDDLKVDAAAISVETLNGTVMLSGFAKNGTEKTTAESLTWKVKGVKAVKNEIAVRP
jgi:hyperosmotically inducible periplasmic protein